MSPLLLATTYSLSFTSPWLWAIALVFLATIVLTYFYYRRTNPPLSRSLRIILGILRGLALLALFFVFAEPLLEQQSAEDKPPVVAILTDNSTSMATNRHSAAQFAAIEDYLGSISSRLPANAVIEHFSFADTVIPGRATGSGLPVTAIGTALDQLAQLHENENLQAVVMLSDGASNLGPNPVAEARKIGVPVTTIGFGDPNPLPDIRIAKVECNPVGFVGKEFPVEVTLESRGFEGLRLPLRLRRGDRVLTRQEIDLVGQGRQQTVKLQFAPEAEGEIVIEASTPVQANEESDKNNSRQVHVKIRASQIRILLAAASLNWDFKFLNRALSAKDDFKVDLAVESRQKIAGTVPFPENIAGLAEYDALILYDFDADWLGNHKQLLDAFFDRTGKGLFFLAAEKFGASAKVRLPESLLPYRFADGRSTLVRQEVQFDLTERGRIHPLMRLAEDGVTIQRILNALPPFTGYLLASDPRPEATVIASVPPLVAGEQDLPIFAAQRYRSGKVACLSAFPFWKLDFLSKTVNEADSTYSRLVENMVLWLVAREDVERVTITPERPIFIAGESVNLSARVLDEAFVPVEDAEVEAVVKSVQNPADSLVVGFRYDRPGLYSADLHYLPSGNYSIRGRVERQGVKLGNPTSSFIVEPYSLEDLSQIANFDLLKRISEVSGGQFYAAADTASIPPFQSLSSKIVVHRSEFALFDNIWLLGIIIAALCVEWYVRKRYQLL